MTPSDSAPSLATGVIGGVSETEVGVCISIPLPSRLVSSDNCTGWVVGAILGRMRLIDPGAEMDLSFLRLVNNPEIRTVGCRNQTIKCRWRARTVRYH